MVLARHSSRIHLPQNVAQPVAEQETPQSQKSLNLEEILTGPAAYRRSETVREFPVVGLDTKIATMRIVQRLLSLVETLP
jgi:hypothetical protein